MKNRTKKRCLLCGALLGATSVPTLWTHPDSEACGVRLTNQQGISVDDEYRLDPEDGQIYEMTDVEEVAQPEPVFDPGGEVLQLQSAFVSSDSVVDLIFESAGVPKLGGISGDRGWSSISTFQKCPYLWKCRHQSPPIVGLDRQPGPPALEIGGLVHVFLAVHYMQMIDSTFPLEPLQVRAGLLAGFVTPDHVDEAWRLFEAYTIYYRHDDFVPLAVEYHLVDPGTGRSCRFDLIARKDRPSPGLLPGTYVLDHKTRGRFDSYMLTEWQNDGELLGQWELYEKLKLEKRFGKLVGLCANIIGKQKDPKFERAWIVPSPSLLRDHKRSLGVWSAAMDLAKATGNFPRARASCVTRHGLCSEFGHCTQSGGEE